MANHIDDFDQLNTALYPITVDKLENAKKLETKYAKRKYPIYYDQEQKVTKLLKQEIILRKLGRMPALLIIDKQGTIQYAYYGDSMHDIPKTQEILETIKKLET
ncbi:MAG: redoxin domain-containing protein [Candidatus Freyarchaeota archaeon]|nr:redoxin domain-containing protein [Candidatus Jordarchaeia archaeon]MBS7267310.1 redoxin domain-containing protein [Candidatus Jordarchaeia archaeon]MBS7278258.1 redoxin domain-containing protein [Candidatus Jordarchaeia archaeon]